MDEWPRYRSHQNVRLQAAPKRKRLQAEEEQRYRNKLVVRANIIIQSANRLWSESLRFVEEMRGGHLEFLF